MLKAILAFLFPGGLLFLLALGFLRPSGLPLWCQGAVAALPYLALAFGLVFGWYFVSTRMLFTLLVVTFADRALMAFPFQKDPDPVSQTVFSLSAFLVPMNILGFSLLREGREGTIRHAMAAMLLLIQPLVVLWLCQPAQQDLALALVTSGLTGWATGWTPIPQAALLAFFIALTLQVSRFAVSRNPMDAGAAWALGTVFLAYHGMQYGWNPTHYLSTAALIVFVSLVQVSYQETYRDELTGISGRQAYEETVAQLGGNFALAVLAIDQLKSYAGSHGRPVVEQVLKLVSLKVESACLEGRVFRVSGEELTLLFPHRSAMEALVALNDVRRTVESASLFLRGRDRVWDNTGGKKSPGLKDRALPVSASIGVAEQSGDAVSIDLVIKSAYRALYEAKAGGGNAVKRATVTRQSIPRSSGRIVTASEY
ncbi:MAG: putative Diguanylate cyclase [Nitrospira sp.]|nr:putative Diguanylate cyclase [Nitrospira sp.]